MATYPPNQSLYINNLPSSKIQKDDLRRELYTLFTTYGTVLDVVALRTEKMRGQAHIVFRDVQTATQAMRALQGFEFYGREMKIQYAKSKSDIISKLDGSFQSPAAAPGDVVSTELQQTIFGGPPAATITSSQASGTLKPRAPGVDQTMADAKSPSPSATGLKRRRDEDEPEEDSEGDVAMDEDSDDD